MAFGERHLRVGDKVTVRTDAKTHPRFWGRSGIVTRLIGTIRNLTYYNIQITLGKDKITQCLVKSELEIRD